ncbi:CHAT domain-containing protein [Solirubrobacter phytolaccae]|uniref:CHAT domain-containing protein n=1 Tax=Solirubrobacter phytolaccae TaxID=1404360 RepID=UPI0022CDDF5F|nr:CHAT domain-containing protein [Solirubrobacter phytolaccae]
MRAAAPVALAAAAAVASALRNRAASELPVEQADDDMAELIAIAGAQTATHQAMVRAVAERSDPRHDAGPAFEHYFTHARALVARMEAANERWPGLVTSETIVGTASSLAQHLAMQADYEDANGDRERARGLRDESAHFAGRYMPAGGRAGMRRAEAMGLAMQGEFNAALLALDEAREAFVAAHRLDDAAQTSLYQANLYEWLGDVDRAVDVLAQVRAALAPRLAGGAPSAADVATRIDEQFRAIMQGIASQAGEDALRLRIVAFEMATQEARLRRELGQLDVAEALFQETRSFHEENGLLASLHFHLAVLAVRRGYGDHALALLEGIEGAFTHGLLRPRRPALRMVQADALLLRGEPERALCTADEAIADLETYPDSELAWKLRWRRGQSLERLRREPEAMAALLDAAAAADRLRKSSLGYRLDTTFLRDKRSMFEAGIDLAVKRRDGRGAALLIELVKARALSATLSIPREARHGQSDEEQAFDALSARLDALDFEVNTAGTMTIARREEWDALLAERTALIERMRIADPRWRGLSAPPTFDVAATVDRLDRRNTTALTLLHRPGRIDAVLLGNGVAEVRSHALTAEVEATLAEYAANLRRASPDEWLFDVSSERGLGLRDLVPAELLDTALAGGALVIVPHGVLHLLPWAGLAAPDGRRALEHTAVSVLPNLTCLSLLDAPFGPPVAAAIIGDPDYAGLTRYPPLEHAAAEIADVAMIHHHRLIAPPCTAEAATEAACRRLATARDLDRGVLHVSAHGTLDASEPLRSGLLFSGGTLLDAAELAQLHLAADEIVLSACSTGWRPQAVGTLTLAGDDALGLPAAALEAGARAVLVSIAPLADEPARDLFVGYHRRRAAEWEPVAAFNGAQRELLAAGAHEPWTWISATAYGW